MRTTLSASSQARPTSAVSTRSSSATTISSTTGRQSSSSAASRSGSPPLMQQSEIATGEPYRRRPRDYTAGAGTEVSGAGGASRLRRSTPAKARLPAVSPAAIATKTAVSDT